MPASNYPGIPVGGAVWLPSVSAIPGAATLYALRAKYLKTSVPATTPCNQLICPAGSGQYCLMENADYWQVGGISQSEAILGTTTVFAVSGCWNGDPSASPERCGPAWSAATGNLHLDVVSLDPTPAEVGGLEVQATQLSPGLLSLQGEGGTTSLSFGAMADAQPIGQLGGEGQIVPISMPLTLPSGLAAFAQVGFGVDVQGVDAGSAGHLWMSLAQAQELVDPAQDPTIYYAGGRYVVAVLGDPDAPHAFADGDGGYDGTGLHLLVLPATVALP
jgi:hypothetical protein